MLKLKQVSRWQVFAVVLIAYLLFIAAYFPYSVDPPHVPPTVFVENAAAFKSVWGGETQMAGPDDVDRQRLSAFIRQYGLQAAKALEVGAGAGKLQDVVDDYTGLDISESSARHFHKPFIQASATAMPFPDDSFDLVWTINVVEHVPHPEHALAEIRRVIKDGGYLFLSPAWQCRSWAAKGYQVRPWSDFGFGGKLIKASIPIRDSVAYRSLYSFPIRLLRSPMGLIGPTKFRYTSIIPNYRIGERFWQSDSDAVNSMDAFETIMWFTSRGDDCLNYPNYLSQVLVRNGPVTFRVNKSGQSK